MKMIKLAYLVTTLALTGATQATDELYDNGSPVADGIGVNSGYQSVLDDVYVPGAGWFVEEVETQGIFLYGPDSVAEVDITIWYSDPSTFEPDGDNYELFENVDFNASATGEQWGGYDKISVLADIPRTYLKGQEYYWVEFDIKAQNGTRMNLIERQGINHLPAHLGPGAGPFASNADLAFKIYGDAVKMVVIGGPSEFKLGGLDKKEKTVSFQIPDGSKVFDPGLYQLQLLRNSPLVYRFDENGKHRIDFKVDASKPLEFHTPIGDDMCKNAPRLLQNYCQRFVACAAHGMYC